MGLFSGCGPIFIKEDSDAQIFIDRMTDLAETASGTVKKEIEKQIKLASYGIAGEEKVAFELKNSGLDMMILHDIYLEYEDLSAQIDYLIIAKKCVYVIECKNLIGDIEIDNKGTFIRSYQLFDKKVREAIYSPVTQNERHLNVLKNVREKEKGILMKALFEKNFNKIYKSIICLANPKTILNDKFAKKELKQQVVRVDQLIAHIKQSEKESKAEKSSEKNMRDLAQFYLDVSKPNKSDYARKYREMIDIVKTAELETENKGVINEMEKKICPRCGAELVLRTAKRGDNVGNQFYGCSAFPKCRYIENI